MPGGAELSEKLPDELFQLVESFKKFMREQKAYKDQKFDIDPILEVDREADQLMHAFQRVSVDSDINRKLIQQIKDDTTKLLRHAELAYSSLRSHITNNPSFQQQQQHQPLNQQPPSLHQTQYNSNLFSSGFSSNFSPLTQQPQPQQQQQQHNSFNQSMVFNTSSTMQTAFKTLIQNGHLNDSLAKGATSPHDQFASTTTTQYFSELADQYETRMKLYGEQIKELKMSLDGIVRTHNPDELFKLLDRHHKSLGEIGAQVYMTHERIMERKAELEKSTNAHSNSMAH